MSIQELCRRLVAEKLGLQVNELAEDFPLAALEWDSLDLLELAVAFEQELGISLNDQSWLRCRTLKELAGLLEAARSR